MLDRPATFRDLAKMILLNPFVSFGGVPPVSDSDAQAFLTAAGITNPTQRGAVDQLVIDLKAAGVWTKMLALYPFVGGSASTHKWNLKDPQDTDGAFRIVWNGSLTHNANGVVSDGSSGYGDTKLVPSAEMQTNGGSLGVWVDDTSGANQVAIGCETANPTQGAFLAPHWLGDGNTYLSVNGAQGAFTYAGAGSSLIQVVRTDATNCFYQTGTTQTPFTGAFNSPTHAIFIAARNNAGSAALFYSSTPIKFAFIGDTLTATEADDFFTAVDAFQTTLGR